MAEKNNNFPFKGNVVRVVVSMGLRISLKNKAAIMNYLYEHGIDPKYPVKLLRPEKSFDYIYEQEAGLFPEMVQVYGYTFKEVGV